MSCRRIALSAHVKSELGVQNGAQTFESCDQCLSVRACGTGIRGADGARSGRFKLNWKSLSKFSVDALLI